MFDELYTEEYCRKVLSEIITEHVAQDYSIDELQHIYLFLEKVFQDARKEILEAMLTNYLEDRARVVSDMVGITVEELNELLE